MVDINKVATQKMKERTFPVVDLREKEQNREEKKRNGIPSQLSKTQTIKPINAKGMSLSLPSVVKLAW